jgi:sRNA-binding carbon storage regulator CsrA
MTIEVEAMEGNRVRLRFAADQSVTILRTELLARPGGK